MSETCSPRRVPVMDEEGACDVAVDVVKAQAVELLNEALLLDNKDRERGGSQLLRIARLRGCMAVLVKELGGNPCQ